MEDTDSSPNVLKFPKKNKRVLDEESVLQLIEQTIEDQSEFVDIALDDIMNDLTFKFNLLGLNLSSQEVLKDIHLIMESIRSMMLKCLGTGHPLQDVAEEIFEIKSD